MTKFSDNFKRAMMDNFDDVVILGSDTMTVMTDYTVYLIEVYFDIINVTDECGNVDVLFESEEEVLEYLCA